MTLELDEVERALLLRAIQTKIKHFLFIDKDSFKKEISILESLYERLKTK